MSTSDSLIGFNLQSLYTNISIHVLSILQFILNKKNTISVNQAHCLNGMFSFRSRHLDKLNTNVLLLKPQTMFA